MEKIKKNVLEIKKIEEQKKALEESIWEEMRNLYPTKVAWLEEREEIEGERFVSSQGIGLEIYSYGELDDFFELRFNGEFNESAEYYCPPELRRK